MSDCEVVEPGSEAGVLDLRSHAHEPRVPSVWGRRGRFCLRAPGPRPPAHRRAVSEHSLSRGLLKQPAPGAQAGIFPIFGLALCHKVQAGLCVGGSPWEKHQPSETFSLFTCPGESQERTRGDLFHWAELPSLGGWLPH